MRGPRVPAVPLARASQRAGSRRRQAGPDGGIVPIIEALIVALLVGGAVLFTVAFQAPPPPSSSSGVAEMDAVTWDAVRSLDNMFYEDPSYANNSLSKAVADSLAGNSTNLTTLLDSVMPPGALYNVYLNNGYGRFVVHESRNATGQTVGTAYPFEPRWRHAYVAPDLEIYHSEDGHNTMGTTIIPIYNSNLVLDQGYLVKAQMTGKQVWIPGQEVLGSADVSFTETAHSTLLQGGTQAANPTNDHPSVALYMHCKRNNAMEVDPIEPCYAVDVSMGDGTPEYHPIANDTLRIVASNSGPGTVAAGGTTIRVELPVGLHVNGTADVTSPDGGFTGMQLRGASPNPQTVTATLGTSLAPGEDAQLDIDLDRTSLDSRYAFKHVVARLEGGAVSEGQFLVKAQDKTEGSYTGGDARTVLVSTPKPHGAGSDASGRWGIVMPVPFQRNEVERFTLELVDGQEVITGVSYPDDYAGTGAGSGVGDAYNEHPATEAPTFTGSKITWEAPSNSLRIDGYEFLELQFIVETNGVQTPGSSKFPHVQADTVYEAFRPPPNHVQIEEGIWWAEHGPKNNALNLPGFPRDNNTLTGRLAWRNTVLNGSDAYQQRNLGDILLMDTSLTQLKDSLQSATITVDDRRVPVGSQASMILDAQDLASYLSQNVGINNMDLETRIYAPWGIPKRIPVKTFTHTASAGSSVVPNAIELGFINSDDSHDVLVASSDGNIYALSGATSASLPGKTFQMPGSDEAGNPSQAVTLSKIRSGATTYYGAGSNAISDNVRAVDFSATATEVWATPKDEANSKVHATNASKDLGSGPKLTGAADGWPELFVSLDASETGSTAPGPAGISRFKLYYGNNGTEVKGWGANIPGQPEYDDSKPTNYGVTINGSATQLGMGKVGAAAKDGVWSNTGLRAGVDVDLTYEIQWDEIEDPEIDSFDPEDPEFPFATSIGMTITTPKDGGLIAYREDGKHLWNMTGGRFVRVLEASEVPTETAANGERYSGIVGGGGDGWAYGLSGKDTVAPVWGVELPGTRGWIDLAGASPYDAYALSEDGALITTRDGWASQAWYEHDVRDYLAYPNLRAVDTPGGVDSYWRPMANISWWAGDLGEIIRSTDHLRTVDELAGLDAFVSSAATVNGGNPDVSFPDLETLDLSNVRWNDVYAVDENEAWFVGEGISGSLDNEGVIGYTVDGGDTLLVHRFACLDSGLPAFCGFNGIDYDGERMWAVGDNGTVLTQRIGGQASKVHFVSSDNIADSGYVDVALTADEQVQVDNITVSWNSDNEVDHMKEVLLQPGDGTGWMWSTDSAHAATTASAFTVGAGADNGAKLNVTTFDDLETQVTDNDVWNGDFTLRFGPFKDTLDPGYRTDPGASTPLNLTVTVDYRDGTEDIYLLGVGDKARTAREASRGVWVLPTSVGFEVPRDAGGNVECFGAPDKECAKYLAINITTPVGGGDRIGYVVGEPQAKSLTTKLQSNIVKFDGATDTWSRVTTVPVQVALNDVAVNRYDVTRAAAVGEQARVLKTYNGGEDWTDLPKIAPLSDGLVAPMHGVSYANPDVGWLAGGSADGLLFTIDGHTEYGRVVTGDLHTDTKNAKWIAINHQDLMISADGRSQHAMIDMWDGASWIRVYDTTEASRWTGTPDPTSADTHYWQIDDPTEEVKLRITMYTPFGASRFSPQIKGTFQIQGFTPAAENIEWNGGNSFPIIDWDLNNTSPIASGLDTVHMPGKHYGFMRLKAISNPWVVKLGNPASDWGDTLTNPATGEEVSQMMRGARTQDMDLSPDGSTLYLATEGIYEIGKSPDDSALGRDDTVYAIDVATGQFVDAWDLLQLPCNGDPPHKMQLVRSYGLGLWAITEDSLGDLHIWSVPMNLTDPGNHVDCSNIQGQTLEGDAVIDARVGQIWSDAPVDLYVAVSDSTTGGTVQAWGPNPLDSLWSVNPSVKGKFQFDYDVPIYATYGAYVVESRFSWDVTAQSGKSVTQTARIHNAFTVTPPDKKVALSPTYTLEVVAWLEDWG